MALQRIAIVKLGGVSADVAFERLAAWSAARTTENPNLWSPEQWPDSVRKEADDFAECLRAHALDLPVIHFVEWADPWSMGDLINLWLTPPRCARPIVVHANRFEIFAYRLPDRGRLADSLAAAGAQQFAETDWFIARLRAAIAAWEKLVERSVLVVLRYAVDVSATDEEVLKSMQACPAWIS